MSLRIRSTKTELEDLGEDAEGAAENVSKLREQMLALTGVDIQLDKNTYKSTYQILLEMSKVWDKLDDMTQASVLEQLFGKRQANIGAAILTNGELLQQVYETSEKASDGIGSAMREQEEYAKSIQYNLDSLKASYQKLAQEIVQSETVVTIIKALNEGLQSLGSSDIVIGINAVSQSLIALTQTALNAKEKIESLPAIGDFASRGLDQVRGVAFLKAAGKIYNWLNKDEKAVEEAARSQEELNVNYEKSLGIYDETSKGLQDLTSEYIKLMASTEDVSSARESLLNLQNSFVDKYGEEAEGLDLVNKSLEDNVRWLIERQKVLDEQFVNENSDKIAQAKERFGVSDLSEGAKYELWDYGIHLDSDEARREAKLYSQEVSKYLKENYSDIFESSIIEGLYEPMIRSGITPAEQVEAAKAIEESYKFAFEKYSSLSNKVIDTNETLSAIGEWRKNLESDLSVLETVAKRIDDIKLTNEFIGDNKTFDKFNELIVDLDKFNDILNSDESTIGEKISASTDIDKVVESLKDIANEYPIVSDLIKTKIESVGLSFDHVTDTFETAKSEWLKSLDEAQKGTLTNVDKIVAAMKKLYSGEAIESKSAWEILNLDDKKLLSDIRIDSNGGYIFDLNQIINLKDEIIKKEIAEREESINTATIKRDAAEKEIAVAKERLEVVSAELAIAKLTKADNVEKLEAEYNKLSAGISATQSAVESYNYTIRNESIYTDELRKKIGSLADTSEIAEARIKALKEEVSALNKEADGLLKAQESVVDGYIKKEQQELDVLEKESDELNKQLDTLEEQKSKTEEILGNYKTVADVVSSTIDKQIEGIEKERQEIEDFYDKQIEELKSANEEREDALEYEKKLANLANAQNNKVRVYDQARGWIYEADKEALQNAQEDLASFETNQQIKAFEKERDKAVEGYDERIKSLEEYGNLWGDFVSEVTDEQNELLANEILGSDWREKISDKDLSVLNKFKTGYTQYNTQLKNIVDVEIANLKKSIEAKDKDVAAKKDQIQAWQDYKSAIQDTANSIKDGLEEYNKYLDTVQLNEKATNEQRLANLDKFASRYREIVDSIADKNALIESTDASISHLSETAANVSGLSTSTSALGGISGIASIADVGSIIEEVLGAMSKIFGSIFHFAKGGAADYTGLAWVDGTKTSSETVFTAAQSKKLLNLVEALPNLNFSLFNDNALRNGIANNTNSNISIGSMTVVANNPQQFAEQFNREINRYWQTKLTENKVY